MSQGDADPELAAMHLAVERSAAETHLPLARLFTTATLISLGQAAFVVLDSVAGPQDAFHGLLYGPIDVLAKATLLLLALVTAATGFTLICPQAGGVRSASTTRHTRPRWFS